MSMTPAPTAFWRRASRWRGGPRLTCGCRGLHLCFRDEALAPAEDGGEGEGAAGATEMDGRIVLGDVAIDLDLVPALGVADIVDGDVVVLTPEERRRGKALGGSQYV